MVSLALGILIAALILLNYALCGVVAQDLSVPVLWVALTGTLFPFLGPMVLLCLLKPKEEEVVVYHRVL